MALRSTVMAGTVLATLWLTAGTARADKPEPLTIYGYVENSYVFNLGDTGRHKTNALRFYDADEGYTFNAAEISLKQDSSEARPFGFGVVVTGGVDSQKNHSL